MPRFAAQTVSSFQQKTFSVLLLVLLSLCTGFSGLAMSHVNEFESPEKKTELVEFETLVTQRCRRRTDCLTQHRLSGIVAAIHAAHPTEPSLCLGATAQSEHAFRNGGIGAPLRC